MQHPPGAKKKKKVLASSAASWSRHKAIWSSRRTAGMRHSPLSWLLWLLLLLLWLLLWLLLLLRLLRLLLLLFATRILGEAGLGRKTSVAERSALETRRIACDR